MRARTRPASPRLAPVLRAGCAVLRGSRPRLRGFFPLPSAQKRSRAPPEPPAEVPGLQTEEAIKTPPFGLTTKN